MQNDANLIICCHNYPNSNNNGKTEIELNILGRGSLRNMMSIFRGNEI